jgi:hypothetical protein
MLIIFIKNSQILNVAMVFCKMSFFTLNECFQRGFSQKIYIYISVSERSGFLRSELNRNTVYRIIERDGHIYPSHKLYRMNPSFSCSAVFGIKA